MEVGPRICFFVHKKLHTTFTYQGYRSIESSFSPQRSKQKKNEAKQHDPTILMAIMETRPTTAMTMTMTSDKVMNSQSDMQQATSDKQWQPQQHGTAQAGSQADRQNVAATASWFRCSGISESAVVQQSKKLLQKKQ